MPRPKNFTLHSFFDQNEKNEILCNNGACSGKILNGHTGNLERHLRVVHLELYSDYLKLKKKNEIRPKIEANFKPKLCKEVNKRNIELAIVELFTKNGRPLCMIEDRAFKILVQPVFDVLNVSVNSHSINDRIIAFSKTMKNEIIKDLKGRLLSVKIDAATRQDLNVLGVNVQYIKNKIIMTKTLAIQQLESSHTSEYLKSVILDVLTEYKIDITQILTIITDSGENMLKAVNDLNSGLTNLKQEHKDDDLEDFHLDDVRSQFLSYSVTSIRCGAHTLQLCVQDVLKNPKIKENIELCRFVVEKLRTETYLNFLKNGLYEKPILDCVTESNSTFNMLERLLHLEEIINALSLENSDLLISAEMWSFIKEFIKVFRPIYTATIKLQTEQLCFSELYVIIMDILFQTGSMPSTEMTVLLTDSLNKRKSKLFCNELFNAAIFLDPRIKVCLTSDQIARAKKYISSINNRIISLKNTNSATHTSTYTSEQTYCISMDQSSTSNNLESSKSFSEFLDNLDRVPTKNEPNSLLSNLERDFQMYDRQQRISLGTNILEFWSNQNNALSSIAEVVLAIPSTQVSLERLFSALNYILADQRNRLTPFILDHLLLVKVNGIFDYDD